MPKYSMVFDADLCNGCQACEIACKQEHDIPVVRRLSGGGAVFHDLGNLNYTFIVNDKHGSFPFEKFTAPIIDVLQRLSIKAERSRRNDLTINGKKFSGSAQYRHKNRLLHHGTLLFSSDIDDLCSALAANPPRAAEAAGRGIRSVISQVTNISDHIKGPLTIAKFHDLIIDHMRGMYKDSFTYTLTDNDLDRINRLATEKYSTWEWNFGNSPQCRNQKSQLRTQESEVTAQESEVKSQDKYKAPYF